MPGPLDALERLMEEAVEGMVQRVFRPRLQPVRLAKAAVREMERQQVVGPSGPEVPNHYAISLHPDDHLRFARFQQALERELARYLDRYAHDHGWRPIGRTDVDLIADSSVPKGRPRVVAQLIDIADASGPAPAAESEIERTLRRSLRSVAAPLEAERPTAAFLEGQDSERYRLRGDLVRIGRALDNDVVVSDARVSRYHAELRRGPDGWSLVDLGSTNGTLVADAPVEHGPLADGETISLGGFELVFRVSESSEV